MTYYFSKLRVMVTHTLEELGDKGGTYEDIANILWSSSVQAIVCELKILTLCGDAEYDEETGIFKFVERSNDIESEDDKSLDFTSRALLVTLEMNRQFYSPEYYKVILPANSSTVGSEFYKEFGHDSYEMVNELIREGYLIKDHIRTLEILNVSEKGMDYLFQENNNPKRLDTSEQC